MFCARSLLQTSEPVAVGQVHGTGREVELGAAKLLAAGISCLVAGMAAENTPKILFSKQTNTNSSGMALK